MMLGAGSHGYPIVRVPIRTSATPKEAQDHVVRTGVLHDAVHFVQKPFAPEAIAHKVREILSS
jgi:hypothetical protein